MAGVNLLDAANFDQGARDRQAADRAAALEQDKLAQANLQTQEMQRQATDAAAARQSTASAWEDAKRAAESANASIRAANQPQEVKAAPAAPDASGTAPAPAPAPGDVSTTADQTPAPDEDWTKNGGGPLYKNPSTGALTRDKSKAYGVVPDVRADTLFEREFAGKVRDTYMKQGAPEMAAKFDDFMQSRTGKRYLGEAHQGLQLIAMGDKQGGLKTLQDLYNSQVHDGRYGKYEDAGGGMTKLTVYDSKTGQSSSQLIPDAELGQRAAQFLDPDYIAKHFLTTSATTQKLQTQFNIDVAKERIKADLHNNGKAQEIALQVRGKLLEQQNQAQLDAMLGKGARVTMDQTGMNILVTVPGQGVFKMDKDGLKPVQNGAFQMPSGAVGMGLDNLVGFTGAPQGAGVSTPAGASAAPAAGVSSGPSTFTATAPDGRVMTFDSAAVTAKLASVSGSDRQKLISQMKSSGVPQATIDGLVKSAGADKTPQKPKRTAVNLDTGDVTMEDDVPAAKPAAPAAPASPVRTPAASSGASAPAQAPAMPASTDVETKYAQETRQIIDGKRKEYSREVLAALKKQQKEKDDNRQAEMDRLLSAQRASTPASASPFRGVRR